MNTRAILAAAPLCAASLLTPAAARDQATPAQPAPAVAPTPTPPAPPAPPAPVAAGTMVKQLQEEAAALRPLLKSDLAKAFVDATSALPHIEPRGSMFIEPGTRLAFSKEEADALPEDRRTTLRERVIDEAYYYTTRYGSPLGYARALDIAAANGFAIAETPTTIVDYGYGTIGHLRLLASLGAHCIGVDTDPLLERVYAPDIGLIARIDAVRAGTRSQAGSVKALTGQWPANPRHLTRVDSHGKSVECDLFISKNTLKRGYVHPDPARTAGLDSRMLVNLGVGDEMFVREVHNILRPGGLFFIYNLCPAPAPEGRRYIPWADGRCPFPKEMLEATGFEVIAFDVSDDAAARAMAHALGWDAPDKDGSPSMNLENDLFAMYTLVRKVEAPKP